MPCMHIQSCPTLCNPMDCSLPCSSVYGISQVRLLEWVAISTSRGSLEGLIMNLKLQYFGHLMQRTDSLEKTLMLGMIEGRRRRGQQRMSWFDGLTNSIDMGLSKL